MQRGMLFIILIFVKNIGKIQRKSLMMFKKTLEKKTFKKMHKILGNFVCKN